MPLDALITLFILVSVVVALATNKVAADFVLMAAVTLLIVFGILSPMEALGGFANPGVITIGALYIVASGLIETGAVQWLAGVLLGSPKTTRAAQLRILFPTSILSAVTNNTTVVAMFTPAIQEWGDRLGIPASKLLIPLSYAAILGGTCTVIGTSTNLIIYGLLQQYYDITLGLFEIAIVGVPLISDSGLRQLTNGYLIELVRDAELQTDINPEWKLQAGDVLAFIGVPELASELRRIRGIKPAEHDVNKLDLSNNQRCIVVSRWRNDINALCERIESAATN